MYINPSGDIGFALSAAFRDVPRFELITGIPYPATGITVNHSLGEVPDFVIPMEHGAFKVYATKSDMKAWTTSSVKVSVVDIGAVTLPETFDLLILKFDNHFAR